ncbi:hypothetical protein [Priestia megaterium]
MTELEKSPIETQNEKNTTSYENFSAFVAISLSIKLMPVVEGLTEVKILKLILSFILVVILVQLFIRNKMISKSVLRVCEHLKINIAILYITYLTLYILVTF